MADHEYRVKSCLPNGAELISWEISPAPVGGYKQYDRRIVYIYRYQGKEMRGNISAQSSGYWKKSREKYEQA